MGASSSGGSGGGSNRYEPPKKKNPIVEFVKGGGVAGAVVRAIQKSAAKSKAKKEANVEIGLGTDRMSNYSTSQGGTRQEGDNNNTPAPTILKKTAGGQTVQTEAPTEAELSQSAAADAEAYDLRKTKKKGRSMTRLTSSQGVIDNKLTLGKPSLLGRV